MKNIDETEGPARKRNVPITEGLPSKYSYSTDSKKKTQTKSFSCGREVRVPVYFLLNR